MAVLVIADHDNAGVRDSTAKAVAAASKLSGDIDVLVAGDGAQGAADAASKIAGVRKVLLAEAPALAQNIAEALTDLVVPLMNGYDALLTPATAAGKNAAPRIAARLDVSLLSDVLAIEDGSTFT